VVMGDTGAMCCALGVVEQLCAASGYTLARGEIVVRESAKCDVCGRAGWQGGFFRSGKGLALPTGGRQGGVCLNVGHS